MNPPSPFLYPKAEGLAPTSSKNALFTSTTYQKLAFLVFGGGDLYQYSFYALFFFFEWGGGAFLFSGLARSNRDGGERDSLTALN